MQQIKRKIRLIQKIRKLHPLTEFFLKKKLMPSMPKRIVLPLFALLLSGCIRPGNDEVLVTPYTKIDFLSDGETREFAISSNFLWTIEIADTWVTINPMKGYGDKQIQVTTAANTSLQPRQTTFIIAGEQTRREITVTQTGETPVLTLDSSQKTIPAAGDTVSVGVTANVELNITPGANWIVYNQTRTITTRRALFTVQPNTTLESRSGQVEFRQKDGSLSAILNITQTGEAPGIELQASSVQAVSAGGGYKVTVVSNIEWQAATQTPWIHLTGTRLMQSRDCNFTVDANPRVESRQGTITIHAPAYPQLGEAVVTVTQEGAEPLAILTPAAIDDVPATGGTYSIAVQANFNWEEDLTGTASWVSKVVGTTNGLQITVDKNDDVQARSTSLNIAQENGSYIKGITIGQVAGERKLYLPPQETIPVAVAAGGTLSIPVVSNVSWEAALSQDWISVVQTKGLETKMLTLQVEANTRIEARQAQLTVTTTDAGKDSLVVTRTILQQGAKPHITLDPNTLNVPAAGGAYTVPVQANVSWNVLSYPSWVEGLQIANMVGYNGELTFTVTSNQQTVARSARIELSRTGGGLVSALEINQAPEAVFVNAKVNSPQFLHNEGDSFTLTVESNIEVGYGLDVNWIINTSKTVEGRTTTWEFQVLPVPTVNNRSAVLQVRETGTQQVYKTFNMTQRGARIAQKDSTALVRFHKNMRGDNWRDTHLWNLLLPAETWPGLTLEAAVRNGALHVKKLELSNGRLEGSVGDGTEKDPLSLLAYLEVINLSNNTGVTGWLPVSWKDLDNLETINLENCNLTNFMFLGYNIPANYATRLKNLTTFIIRNNLLNGVIPAEITEHPHFEEWNFEENMQPQKGTNRLTLPDAPAVP